MGCPYSIPVRFALLALTSMFSASASEADASAISHSIQALHFPHSTILDPIFDSPTGTQIVNYTRCGDSAIWTGHYLAAEAFRYAVHTPLTHSPTPAAPSRVFSICWMSPATMSSRDAWYPTPHRLILSTDISTWHKPDILTWRRHS